MHIWDQKPFYYDTESQSSIYALIKKFWAVSRQDIVNTCKADMVDRKVMDSDPSSAP